VPEAVGPLRPIRKVLVANRGEIAVRVMRTCRRLGIRTVAVFSDADREAPHVRMADEAHHVGESPSADSYLKIDRIIQAALKSGVDAVHPGYGFLSENASFAEACAEAGIIFIGPRPDAIRAMGDKTAARALMEKAGVPMAPGTIDPIETAEEGGRIAAEIGYPVLIKAAAGGGGKGMRVVDSPADFAFSMERAQSEARAAFGDGRVFLEKFIREPRHVEIQVLADADGNIVHLFERECSIQRRHQKVIEEAPSPVLTPEVREAMGNAAIEVARAVDYVNAGTVEFLVDSDLNFYFMEMNTRLQVEHPVTEEITGTDLVAEQLRIAEGHPLSFSQEDLSINGHAIECRIYAEDPQANFLPDPGPLLRHRMPSGPGVRVDSGVEEGGRVEMYYDPMIAKLVTWGSNRTEAIDRMKQALDEYEIAGVRTTGPFCRFVMQQPDFRQGDFSTRFIERHFRPEVLEADDQVMLAAAVSAAFQRYETEGPPATVEAGQSAGSRWVLRRQFR
jgi:acetyl-CoA carboxylase, biotin carboxylase subunit